MDALIPHSWKDGTMLDGNVGWIGTYDGGMGIPNEGVGMVDMVNLGDVLIVGPFMG